MKYFFSFKGQNNYINKLKNIYEKEIFSIKKFKDYLYNFYFYPKKNYEKANKKIKIDSINKDIILVLSGGGARGAAHGGILKILELLNFNIKAIIGTSIGSIIGAFIVSGYKSNDIFEIFKKEKNTLIKLSRYRYISQKKMSEILFNFLNKYIKIKKIEDSSIPLIINTADLKSCERVLFEKGDLINALMASAAIPFMFEPIEINDYLLVDGGAIDNFSVDYARIINEHRFSNKCSIIISDVSAATDITSPINRTYFLLNLSKEFIETFKVAGTTKMEIKNSKDIVPIMNNLLYILKRRKGLAPETSEKDIIITPLLEKMGVFEFKKCEWAFEKGIVTASMIFYN